MALTVFPQAARVDIVLQQGARFVYVFTWQNSAGVGIDITGCTIRAKVRANFNTSSPVLLTMTGSIVGPATDGKFMVEATAAQIAAITPLPAADDSIRAIFLGFWDVEIDDGAAGIARLVEGEVQLSKEATV